MGKTKNQLATVGEPMTKQESRAAMNEARRRVRNMLKGKNPEGYAHMGEMPYSYDDAVRIIIALQDECEDEKEAHNKATAHITALLHDMNMLAEQLNAASLGLMMHQMESGQKAQATDGLLKYHMERSEKANTAMIETNERLRETNQEVFKLQMEKEALLQTIKILSDGRR